MISKITMENVASYKTTTFLETDKIINLIYGHNGTGKTVLSNYLYSQDNPIYSSCAIEGLAKEKVLVYNQTFISDTFFEKDSLKGIFTLSKENKVAEDAIRQAQAEISKIEAILKKLNEEKEVNQERNETNLSDAENVIWSIKTTYTGGDRVFEYCLEGLKGRKEALFNYINGLKKPDVKPTKSIDELKKEIELLANDEAISINSLELIKFTEFGIEKDDIYNAILVGNENSSIAGLIKKLGNSDWIKKGLSFISEEPIDESIVCPFCQEKTITAKLIGEIREYFDENYENAIERIRTNNEDYSENVKKLPVFERYLGNIFSDAKRKELEKAYLLCKQSMENNTRQMETKLQNPSLSIKLNNTEQLVLAFNKMIEEVNLQIKEYNAKLKKRDETLEKYKKIFWEIMRWDYDQTLSKYRNEITRVNNKEKELDSGIDEYETKIKKQQEIIVENQMNTVNIDEAINNINFRLLDLGIDSFSIAKYQEKYYQLNRNGKCDKTFQTLSEGEKMIISFLYFIELCKGKDDAKEENKNKIVVIDDPISSLSHIYVFNIGQLIKRIFFESSNYEQIFLLTHSLYFFYEMTEIKHEKREETQKLFRISKNTNGSQIVNMKYEEIQNDYQAYWYVVRDTNQPDALIANCMRNIIEYFFNFIEKKDLNNLFQKAELQENRFQSFYRFINRESHSLGQNIFDYKEFDYKNFRDAFELVFKLSGYENHYNKMIGKK